MANPYFSYDCASVKPFFTPVLRIIQYDTHVDWMILIFNFGDPKSERTQKARSKKEESESVFGNVRVVYR
jgi:hypothetical protein